MTSILDSFKKQLEKDRKNENYEMDDAEAMKTMDESDFEEYKKEVDKLREKMYVEEPERMSTKVENKSYPISDIAEKSKENIRLNEFSEEEMKPVDIPMGNIRMVLRHAKCPLCGEEIVTKTPTLYNPFSFKRFANQTCNGCGAKFITERGYPRVVLLNEKNEEITAYFN